MCEPTTIMMGMMAVGAASGLMGAHDKAKSEGAAIDAQRKQQIEMVRQNNMANADLSLSAKDKYDQAQQQMTEVNLKAIKNQGMLNAAIGESGLSGGSMDRIKRVTEADSDREKSNIRENYQRDYQAIFANQVGNTETTKSQLKGMGKIQRTSKLAQALSVASSTASSAAQGYSVGKSLQT